MISVAKGMGFSNQLQAASLNPFLHRISQKNLLGQGFSSYPEGFSVSFYPHGRNFICHFFSSFVEILSMYLRFTHLKCTVPWLSLYSQSCIAVTMPRPARGAGTLIPSAQRFFWAAKQPLGSLNISHNRWRHHVS